MPLASKSPSRISVISYFKGSCWARYTTAIKHYSWEFLGAGKGIKPASPARKNQTRVARVKWPKQKYTNQESNPVSSGNNPVTQPTRPSVRCTCKII